jgi:hypothetical protein
VTARVEWHGNELMLKAMEWGERAVEEMSDAAIRLAQEWVSPGIGPGPHPHITPHDDTGLLHDEVVVLERFRWHGRYGFLQYGNEGANYGYWLELGFHSRSGAFWIYPWLWPTTIQIVDNIDAILEGLGQVD